MTDDALKIVPFTPNPDDERQVDVVAWAIWEAIATSNQPRMKGASWKELTEYCKTNPREWQQYYDRSIRQARAVLTALRDMGEMK